MHLSIQRLMKAERQHWRMASVFFGGWYMLALAVGSVFISWIVCARALLKPKASDVSAGGWIEMVASFSGALFLVVIAANIHMRKQRREHALLRLAPKVDSFTGAINRRLALAALLGWVPAIVLRALVAAERSASFDGTLSLASVPMQAYVGQALLLAYVAALIVITFGGLRVPARFAGFPICFGVQPGVSWAWQWVPLVACAIIVVAHRIWLRSDMAWVARVDTHAALLPPSLMERIRGVRLRRAARTIGPGGAGARVTALLATQHSAFSTLLTIIIVANYTVLAPGVFDMIAVGGSFAYLTAALLATPTPIPLVHVMLMPLGAERRNVGRILLSVWMRDMRFRLVLGVTVGLLLRALFWWLDPSSFMRWPQAKQPVEWMLLVWTPLLHAAGLYGAAYAICCTLSASPRWLTRPSLLTALPIFTGLGCWALGAGMGWLVGACVPVLNSQNMSAIKFAIVNAACLPLLAWWVNRLLRPQWLTANLGAISTAMQTWSASRRKTQLTK